MHWVHWLVVCLSVLLTFGAWHFSKMQIAKRVESRFHLEADRAVELIKERMELYEYALWASAALFDASERVDHAEWITYANSLRIDQSYPGINGIGVIHNLQPSELEAYLDRERLTRPDYRIHPEHKESEYWPITYIEPASANIKAVGLDMAFESNRYTAIKKARDTGKAQLTGPIVLVQDDMMTPGFLFYTPFYKGGHKPTTTEERQALIEGVTYAPFIMCKLMHGTLAQQNRHVGLSIRDGDDPLYHDEHLGGQDVGDEEPLYRKRVDVPMYGRTWTFDLWSDSDFLTASSDSQPYMILMGGLLIDMLLLALFVLLSRANRNALAYADRMTEELRVRTEHLEKSNKELDEFSYVASHDLQEPLRKLQSFSTLLRQDVGDSLNENAQTDLKYISESANRMQTLVKDLLALSRTGRSEMETSTIPLRQCALRAIEDLDQRITESGAQITLDDLPEVEGDATLLNQLYQNLISNAVKYCDSTPVIRLTAQREGGVPVFGVHDNGIGIKQEYQDQIFVAFKRLHGRDEYEGTGVGLATCRKVVERHGGELWVESEVGGGSHFKFTLGIRRGVIA